MPACRKPKPAIADPVLTYAKAVYHGQVVAGELVRLACQRHLDDLEHGSSRGLVWDLPAALRALQFFGLLRHSKGRWAGKPFTLEPWQQWFVGCLFGWKRTAGTRRFRTAHLEVARKNGKTTLASGIGLMLFLLDREPGAEVYTCATKRDQAKLTHSESARMVQGSPSLLRRVVVYKDNLSVPSENAKYEPLAAEGHKLDGLNPSGVICDEIHAWRERLLWDVMETATGARSQPLTLITTTAGYDRHSIWWERRELALRVLRGVIQDDSLFAAIYTLDPEDDWLDEKAWAKANPSLGVTVQREELREKAEQARATPGKQNPFKRLRLNVPTDQANLWLDMDAWRVCGMLPVNEEELRGRDCYGGLDLSATTDTSAWVLLFPPSGDQGEEREPWKVLVRVFLPGDDLHEREVRDGVPYSQWEREGWLTLTDGNVIDYDQIERQILADAQTFCVREIAFDRYFANQLVLRLQEQGLEVVGFGQGFASMAAPAKEFEELLVSGRLAHGSNPVLTWQASCAAAKQDPAGNTKPDKASSTGRIDSIVAILMALGRAIGRPDEGQGGGYETWE